MDDAEAAMLDDLISQWISKGVTTALSAAGSQSAKILLTFILEGTTDPSAAKLNQISNQLSSIKAEISNLPHDTAVYLDHFNAINEAQSVIAEFTELLTYTSQRKISWPTYEAYLASLSDTQWKQLINFVLPGTSRNYFALCNKVVISAYDYTITDILESTVAGEIKYGNSDRSYARYVNGTVLKNQPVDIFTYINAHDKIRHTVLTTITAVVSCVQLVLRVFRTATNAASNAITCQRSQKVTDQITDRLKNLEIIARFDTSKERPIPQFYTDLFTRIIDAPAYLCGNAFAVYNRLVNKDQFFYLKNFGTQNYLALKDYEGDAVDKNALAKVDNLLTMLKPKPLSWNIRFEDKTSSFVSIAGKGTSYLYIDHPANSGANILRNAPTQAIFDQLSVRRKLTGDVELKWKLQLISKTKTDQEPGKFTFFITMPKYKTSLQNLDFFLNKGLGMAIPNSESIHNQWEIVPV